MQQADKTILAGELGYILVSFICITSNTLAIKKNTVFPAIIKSINLHDITQINEFLDEQSPFSHLQKQSVANDKALTQSISPSDILNECRKMDGTIFLNLKQNINRLDSEISGSLLSFLSPILEEEKNVLRLKDVVGKFKLYLKTKLGNEHGDSISSEEPKKMKLYMRYHAISWLSDQLENKTYLDLELTKNIKKIIQYIIEKHPDWFERNSGQKITDFLSIGIKPIYRGFFSHEHNFELEIKELCEKLEYAASEPVNNGTIK